MNGHSRKVYVCRGGYPVPQAHRIMHFMAQFNIYISVRSLPYLPALVARARGHGIQLISCAYYDRCALLAQPLCVSKVSELEADPRIGSVSRMLHGTQGSQRNEFRQP
jgi:hypothetical protein